MEEILTGTAERELLHESVIVTATDEEIPVRVAGVALQLEGRFAGSALIMQDLRQIRRLEREKLDAERLAAVGQTVAGLAHGIKNIITGLEGGMYVSASGMKRGDEGRIRQGWEMLERNVARISELSRSLLAFSRGERLRCRTASLAEVVHEVVALYEQSASRHGIDLHAEIECDPEPAYVDPEGLHSCLANLVSNAIDACLMSSDTGCEIVLRLYEKERTLYLEVTDTGCGMDYEVKQKAFTSFFSTKGKGGTGLGLLLTRKIVQQHGGAITLGSEPGQGTTFTITLPRDRLPEPDREERA
jgi:signal transduction histidine kinase